MEKEQSLSETLVKVSKGMKDADIRSLCEEVLVHISKRPELEVRISKTDYESVVFTNEQGRPLITTLGRLMTRQLGYDPNKFSLAIQILTDAYLAEVRRSNVSFDIVSGYGIVEAYEMEWGAHSCMTGSDSKYTQFLAENDDNCHILLFKDRASKARALLWDTMEGVQVLDRIYPNAGWHIEVIYKWADSLGIIKRVGNSLPSGSVIHLSNKKHHKVSVYNPKNIWSYMDTFTFGAPTDKKGWYILSNSFKMKPESEFSLATTGGRPITYFKCHHCKGTLSPFESNARIYDWCGVDRIEVLLCNDCLEEHRFNCKRCGNAYYSLAKSSKIEFCVRCAERNAQEAKQKSA